MFVVIPLGSAERSRRTVSSTCALVLGEVTTCVACCGPPTPGFELNPAFVLGPLLLPLSGCARLCMKEHMDCGEDK